MRRAALPADWRQAPGAIVELIGVDAFHLLFGRAPADMTGALEGLILGGAVGASIWFATRGGGRLPPRSAVGAAALAGAAAGVVISLVDGRMLAGSLDMLARAFPGSRLGLDRLGALVGESGFGPVAQAVTAALEGALFAGCVVGAMLIAARRDRGESVRRR